MKIIDLDLLERFRVNRCEWCGRSGGAEGHHYWFKRSYTRIDHPYNLVSLCRGWHKGRWRSCHDKAEKGLITKHDLLAVVAAREKVQQVDILSKLEQIRKAGKYDETNNKTQASPNQREGIHESDNPAGET